MKTMFIYPLVGGVSLLVGCVSPDPTQSFNDVQKLVPQSEATSLAWHRDEKSVLEAERFALESTKTNLTVQTAVLIGLRNNRKLQGEFESLGISQAEVAQATRLKNPEISGSWRMPIRGGAVNAEYDLAQDVFDLLLSPARKAVARENHEITKMRVAAAIVDFVAQLQSAYYSAAAAQEVATRLELVLEVNEAATDISQRQFKAGNINRLELEGELALLAQTRVEAAQARAEVRAAREQLNRLMGVWGQAAQWHINTGLPPLPGSEHLDNDLEAAAVSKRLDLQAAKKEAELLSRSLRLKNRFRYVPGANVGINAEHELDHAWILGPTLEMEVPLFDQGQPEIARLQSEFRASQRRLEGLAIDIRSEVREARDRLISARDTAEFHQKVLLPQRQRLLKETLLHYNAMQISNQALLAAKEREQMTAISTIHAVRDYWIARAELERVCGRILTEFPAAAVAPQSSQPPSPHEPNH